MADILDLDKRRAERDDKPHRVVLDGDEWELPARLPLVVAEDLSRGNLRAVIAGTFGANAGDERSTEKVVTRIGKILDKDLMEEVLDELYDLGDKPKKGRKQPQDRLPKA